MKKTLYQLAILAALYLIACYDPQPPPTACPHLICAACGAWISEAEWNSHWAVKHGFDSLSTEPDFDWAESEE